MTTITATTDAQTPSPKTPTFSAVSRRVPPAIFRTSSREDHEANDESDLHWSGSIEHLLLPTLSTGRTSQDDEQTEETSVQSFATSEYTPQLSLRPRMSPLVEEGLLGSTFLDIPSLSSPTTPKTKPPSTAKCWNESFTTFESTWCLSEHAKPSFEDGDSDDDASLAYSIDDDCFELTHERYPENYQVHPPRTLPTMLFDEDSADSIPKLIMVPQDSWDSVLMQPSLAVKPH